MHTPSENTFDGIHYDLEFHFLHKDYEDGSFAVISVSFDVTHGGSTPNKFINQFNFGPNDTITLKNMDLDTLFNSLDRENLYNFDGSLTTPPCSENVRWLLFSSP